MKKNPRLTIGLALGSGGARGLAHIGVIKVLKENNIPIDYIAGSSIGSIVGGLYAAGLSIEEIEKIALETSGLKMFSMIDPRLNKGLVGGEKVKTFLEEHSQGKTFEDCKIPFAAVATDIKTGEIVILNTGKLSEAIRASISIPLVFKPVEIGSHVLADGGLSLPVPVQVVKDMGADIVIAVNLDKHHYDAQWKSGWYDTANASLSILRHHLALLNMATADIVIDIDVNAYWYEFIHNEKKIKAGERLTKNALPRLKALLTQKKDLTKRRKMP